MKKSALLLIVAAFIAAVAMPFAHAQPPPESNDVDLEEISTIPLEDKSSQLMGGIFGDAWYDLSFAEDGRGVASRSGRNDTSGGILGAISLALNVGALAMVIFIITMSGTGGAISAVREGVAMGQRYNATWVPLRQAGATIATAPVIGGYSMIQGVIMLAITVGIGIGNLGYKAVFDYVDTEGVITTPEIEGLTDLTANALRMQTCMLELNKDGVIRAQPVPVNEARRVNRRGRTATGGSSTTSVDRTTDLVGFRIDGTPASGLPRSICGSLVIELNTSGDEDVERIRSGFVLASRDAFVQLMNDTQPIAAALVDPEATPDERALFAASVRFRRALTTAAAQLVRDATAYSSGGRGDSQLMEKIKDDMVSSGWIYMGAFYWNIQRYNGAIHDAVGKLPSTSPPRDGSYLDGQASGSDITPDSLDDEYQLTRGRLERYLEVANVETIYDDYDAALAKQFATTRYTESPGKAAALFREVFSWSDLLMDALDSGVENIASGGDAVANLQSIGRSVTGLLETGFWSYVGLRAVSSGASSNAIGKLVGADGVVSSIWEAISGPIGIMFLALFILALFLGYVLPFIPFMMWILGVTGWIIGAVKAVFAGPIWAASFALPDGDGWNSQQSRNGNMLFLGIIMRPILMIIGFIAGMLVLNAVALLVALLFPLATRSLEGGSTIGLIGFLMFFGLFVVLLITTAQRSFALCHELPDEILKWIGGGVESLGDAEYTRQSTTMIAGGMSRIESSAGRGAAATMVGRDHGVAPTKGGQGGGNGGSPGGGGGNRSKATSTKNAQVLADGGDNESP